MRRLSLFFAALFALSLMTSACGPGGNGGPSTPGQYSVQKDSVHFDGDRYQLYWADNTGSLHQLDTRNLRLVRDPDRTFLDVPQGGGDPILHMREDEPITVHGQDHQGAFSSPWFPFLLGAVAGNELGGGGFGGFGGRGGGQTIIINNPAPGERSYDASSPTYRYPPTGSFGRGDELHGTVDTSKPTPPDYSKVQPAPYATSAQSSGTGGGTAATNKSPGAATGTAASNKGGFASGTQSFANRDPGGSASVGAGSRGVLNGGGSTGGTSSKPSTGLSGSMGISGARAPSLGKH
jgi:hypothetical protein